MSSNVLGFPSLLDSDSGSESDQPADNDNGWADAQERARVARMAKIEQRLATARQTRSSNNNKNLDYAGLDWIAESEVVKQRAPPSVPLARASVPLATKTKATDYANLDWIAESEVVKQRAPPSVPLARTSVPLATKSKASGSAGLDWIAESEVMKQRAPSLPAAAPVPVAAIPERVAKQLFDATLASMPRAEHSLFRSTLINNVAQYRQTIANGDHVALEGFFGKVRKAARNLFTSKKDKARMAEEREAEEAAARTELRQDAAAVTTQRSQWMAERNALSSAAATAPSVSLEGRSVGTFLKDLGRKAKRGLVGADAPQPMSVYTGAAVGAKAALLTMLVDAKTPVLLADLPAASSPFQAAASQRGSDRLLFYTHSQKQRDLVAHKDVVTHTLVPTPGGALAGLSGYAVVEYDLRRAAQALTLSMLLDTYGEIGRVRGQKLGIVLDKAKLSVELLPQIELSADEAVRPGGLLDNAVWFSSGSEKPHVPPIIFRFEPATSAAPGRSLERKLLTMLVIVSANGDRKRVLLSDVARTLNGLVVDAVAHGSASMARHEQALAELAPTGRDLVERQRTDLVRASEVLATALAVHVMPGTGQLAARTVLDDKHVIAARTAALPLSPLAREYRDTFLALGCCCEDNTDKASLQASATSLAHSLADATQTYRAPVASVLSQMLHAAFAHGINYHDGADRLGQLWEGGAAQLAQFDSHA